MLTVNLTKLFRTRNIARPSQFLIKNGYSASMATRLVHGRFLSLRIHQLEKLCEIFSCTPNDLYEWRPNAPKDNNPSHPLYCLKESDESIQLKNEIETLVNTTSVAKLKAIKKAIDEINNPKTE